MSMSMSLSLSMIFCSVFQFWKQQSTKRFYGHNNGDLRNSAINTAYHKSYRQSLPLQFRCAALACDKHHAISQISLQPDCPRRFYSHSRESPISSFAVNACGLESFAGDYTAKRARGPGSSPTGSPADWDNYTADSAPRNLCWSSAFLSQVALSCTARRLGREPNTRGLCIEPALRQCRSKKYRLLPSRSNILAIEWFPIRLLLRDHSATYLQHTC